MDAAAWDERYAGSELLWTAEPNGFLVEEVGEAAPGRALDLACGEGRNAVWLAQQGWEVTGVDFSAAGLDKARALADARGVTVRWIEADVLVWDPPPDAFDLVAVLYLHLPPRDRRAVLRRAAGAVRPGGTLLVVGHHRDNLEEGYGGPPVPEILLDPAEVAADVEEIVEVERADRVLRPVETDGRTVDAVDALVRGRRLTG